MRMERKRKSPPGGADQHGMHAKPARLMKLPCNCFLVHGKPHLRPAPQLAHRTGVNVRGGGELPAERTNPPSHLRSQGLKSQIYTRKDFLIVTQIENGPQNSFSWRFDSSWGRIMQVRGPCKADCWCWWWCSRSPSLISLPLARFASASLFS
jgi:hypothetical protein